MAHSFLAAVAKEIISKLIAHATEEMKLVMGLNGMLKEITDKLQTIEALLADAGNSTFRVASVELWLKKLRAVCQDADDVLDEFAWESLRRKMEVGVRKRSKVRNFFSLSNPLAFNLKMARKLKDVDSRLEKIYEEANRIGLKPVEIILNTACNEKWEIIRQTQPFVDEVDVVGRENDVEKVVDKLLSSNYEGDLPVVSIVGMGGLGKTTVAQLVYKNERVVGHFDERIWLSVSHDFDVNRLLNEMVQLVTKSDSKLSNTEAVVKRLADSLKGKHYLLVLDDVWNEDFSIWKSMKASLLGINGGKRSKILVTTRSVIVGSTMETSSHFFHHLVRLSEYDSLALFKKRAFSVGGPKETSHLMEVGKRLVEKCGGLPLAISALGGLLRSKKDEEEWLLIEKSELWTSQEEFMRTGILPILRLSFDHLPSSSLKQCFAYCAILPKGSPIEKQKLVQLWMAQGYLTPPKGSNLMMEDVGEKFVNTLLWNSMLQDVERDAYGNILRCTMHDFVHDLAGYVSKYYGITSTAWEVNHINDGNDIRHLSLVLDREIEDKTSRVGFRKLRTIFSLHNNLGPILNFVLGSILKDSPRLRALSLGRSGIVYFPSEMSNLKHVRYLDISGNEIAVLPSFITKLYNLQTLRISGCLLSEEFPIDFGNLVSLRHLYMDDFGNHRKLMPIGMGRLTSLQTLPFFAVGREEGRGIDELGSLGNLRGELKIYNLEHVRGLNNAREANLENKSRIDMLKLQWSCEREEESNNDESVLAGLRPHRSLKKLVIENFEGQKLASWMMVESELLLLYNLVWLELNNCKRLEQVPSFGLLPSLKLLVMEGLPTVKCIGPEFYSSDQIDGVKVLFPALRRLNLIDMPSLVEWSEARHSSDLPFTVFPCLENLAIFNCHELMTIPSHFPSMKILEIESVKSSALVKMSGNLTSLTSLDIQSTTGSEINITLKNFLENNASRLKNLTIKQCDELFCLPNELHGLVSLKDFEISDCSNLTSIPDSDDSSGLACLQNLGIINCDELIFLPSCFKYLKSLETLRIAGCPNMVSLDPLDISSLTSLNWLTIINTRIFETCTCWPAWLLSLSSLKTLGIGDFSNELDHFPLPSNLKLPLQSLALLGNPRYRSLPDQLQHYTSLTDLRICYFSSLETLPEWLGNLSSLESLEVLYCENLKYLPSVEAIRRLRKLWCLDIGDCPLLKENWDSEWRKIAHIRSIEVDSVRIQHKDC